MTADRIRQRTEISPHVSAWLNLMRALSALAVLHGHALDLYYGTLLPQLEHGRPLLNSLSRLMFTLAFHAHDAVIVFFVLSGYLVGGPFLVRYFNRQESYVDYIIARTTRLYAVIIPALCVTFLFDSIAISFFGGAEFFRGSHFFPPDAPVIENLGADTFVCNALHLQTIFCNQYGSNLALWSLSNEALYYSLFIALLAILRQPRVRGVIVAVIILVLLLVSGMRPSHAMVAANYFLYFFFWCSGTLMFVINKDSLSKIFSITTLIILVAAGLMIRRYGGWGGWFVEALADTGLCLMTVATLFFLEITDVRCRLGASRIISLIARFSFSLYAVHLPVVVLLLCAIPWLANKHDVEWGNHLLYLILLTFVLLISFLCYLVTERNTAKIRACARRWITGQSAHRPVTAGE